MKQKISVEIHKKGDHTNEILEMVASMNDGKAKISIADLQSYLKARAARWPTLSNDLGYVREGEGETLDISSDGGETFSLSLTWKEVWELEPAAAESPTLLLQKFTAISDQHPTENDIPENLYQSPKAQ